jgi:hypothetical protein
MPTFGWVREDAWENFLNGVDHVPDPGLPSPPNFCCFVCSQSLATLENLQSHLANEHQIARPFLTINGQEANFGQVVRTRHAPASYATANTTSAQISIGGGTASTIPLSKLSSKLARFTGEIISLNLVNEAEKRAAPVASNYRILFRIADAQQLRAVEAAFQTFIMPRALTLSTIRDFLDSNQDGGPAREYADGIAKYLTAILVKERPADQGITTPVSRYRELFGSALQILSAYPRPLARSLSAISQFAVNDFPARHLRTGFEELDFAMAFFKGPAVTWPAGHHGAHSNRRPAYPIDHGTWRVLELCRKFSALDRWGPVPEEECRQIADSSALDIMDRDKALAIWALTALRLGISRDAIVPLKRLSATYPFSKWAAPCLEEINK